MSSTRSSRALTEFTKRLLSTRHGLCGNTQTHETGRTRTGNKGRKHKHGNTDYESVTWVTTEAGTSPITARISHRSPSRGNLRQQDLQGQVGVCKGKGREVDHPFKGNSLLRHTEAWKTKRGEDRVTGSVWVNWHTHSERKTTPKRQSWNSPQRAL